MSALVSILIGVATLSLIEAIYSFWSGLRFRREIVSELSSPAEPEERPAVCVILPCRGVDAGLERNLVALMRQDYPNFHVVLVTGGREDSSVRLWERIRSGWSGITFCFSGQTQKRSQKVHNLLKALKHLRPHDEVLVFMDSDIRPDRQWLRALVSGLQRPGVGISTGFRWYLPVKGNFASRLRSAWNSGVVSLMFPSNAPFAWGGAMAIRRRLFERLQIEKRWEKTLSDDYSISEAVHNAGLTISFRPRCLSFSHEDCRLGELFEWIHRQLFITRVCRPGLWWAAVVAHSINLGALLGTLGLALWSLKTTFSAPAQWLVVLVAVSYLLGCGKAAVRLSTVARIFPERRESLMKYRWACRLWGPLASLFSLAALFRSVWTRSIQWRGIRYSVGSCENIEVVSVNDPAAR